MQIRKSIIAHTVGVGLFLVSSGLAGAQDVATSSQQGQNVAATAPVESTWTGKIEQKELNGSNVYVFTVSGQSYIVSPQEKAADYVGKTVKVTGSVEGSTLTITAISKA